MKRIARVTIAALAMLIGTRTGHPQSVDKSLERFREIYKELVETNTTLSAGDCTLAAKRMADRLKTAGYPDEDVRIFVPEGHPKEGGLLAALHGSDPSAKAILMLAHVDVVEAKREDWTRDPFTLIEEDGYFYGRGTSDMKAQAAIWVDNLIRYREEGYKPKRTIKLAPYLRRRDQQCAERRRLARTKRPRRYRCGVCPHRGRRRRS
jgi:acetylornithine deacetylase/succinyl-diaminopimelate desuccinylase-like protein